MEAYGSNFIAFVVGSNMYSQTNIQWSYLSFATGMLGRYQINPGFNHWRATKKVIKYLQGTKEHMLAYKVLSPWGDYVSKFGLC